MNLRLVELAGEFCTRRTAPALPKLLHILESCIQRNEKVEIDTSGVKILTPSFVDELIPPLIVKFGHETVQRLVVFSPPLTGFLKEQITRGARLRGVGQR